MRKRLILKVSVISIVSVVTAGIILKVKRVYGQTGPPCTSEWVTGLQHGIESEAPCPTSSSETSANIGGLASFIRYRSGILVSNTIQQRLAQLEQESWPGDSGGVRRLKRQDVRNIVTSEYLRLASSLTDSQIENMAQSFQTVPAWVPPNRSSDLLLDPSGPNVSATDFIQGLEELRSGNASGQAAAGAEIARRVDKACDVLAYALPSDWNVTYYSPYQVFVLVYSLSSGDGLADSRTECETRMSRIEDFLSQRGFIAPAAGRALYGETGYFYTRPTSILFSDAVQSDLLNRYAAVRVLSVGTLAPRILSLSTICL